MDRPTSILVVEDEVLVRMSVAAYLRDCGYNVIEAKDADEAVLVLKTQTPVDIVFSDIHMPGAMDGFALAQWIRREQPDIKVILTSGVARSAEVANELCDDENALMPKPYDHRELLHRIRRLIARG